MNTIQKHIEQWALPANAKTGKQQQTQHWIKHYVRASKDTDIFAIYSNLQQRAIGPKYDSKYEHKLAEQLKRKSLNFWMVLQRCFSPWRRFGAFAQFRFYYELIAARKLWVFVLCEVLGTHSMHAHTQAKSNERHKLRTTNFSFAIFVLFFRAFHVSRNSVVSLYFPFVSVMESLRQSMCHAE